MEEIIQDIKVELYELYTTKQLEAGWKYAAVKFLSKQSPFAKDGSKQVLSIDQILAITKKSPKQNLADALAKLISNDDFLKFVIDEYGDELICDITWNTAYGNFNTLNKEYHFADTRRYYSSELNDKRHNLFLFEKDYYNFKRVYWPQAIKFRVGQLLERPRNAVPQPIAKPNFGNETYFSNEDQIFNLVPQTVHMITNDLLKRGTKGNLLGSGVKTIMKNIGYKEIFPAGFQKKLDFFSITFILESIDSLYHEEKNTKPTIDLINLLFKKIYSNFNDVNRTIFSVYGGSKSRVVQATDQKILISVLVAFAKSSEWYSIDNYIDLMRLNDIYVHSVDLRYGGSLELPLLNPVRGYNKYEIDLDHHQDLIHNHYYKGFLYIMASLGIIDIYNDFEQAQYPIQSSWMTDGIALAPYHSIQYFRVTNLGRYVFGISDSYEAPTSTFKATEISLDNQNLTLRISKKDDIIANEIKKFANQLGEKLFMVNDTSVIKYIKSSDDIDMLINHLENLTNITLPPIWISFFDRIRLKFNPVKVIKGNYNLYSVSDKDPEFLKILMQDEKLGKCFLKVEGKRILINRKDLNAFQKRLGELGWVLE